MPAKRKVGNKIGKQNNNQQKANYTYKPNAVENKGKNGNFNQGNMMNRLKTNGIRGKVGDNSNRFLH